MLFFKVKPQFDNTVINKKFDILVKDELYTAKEAEKVLIAWINRYNYTSTPRPVTIAKRDCFFRMFERVEIKKNRTYWFFGARYACEMEA